MVSNKRAPGNGGTLLLIAGEPQSRLFFRCGPIGFLNRDYSNGGGCLCPRGQLWWRKHKLTQSAQGSQLFHLLIHQNAEILKSYLPLPNVFNLLLIGFKWNYVGPRENPTDYFLWSPVQHCHLFQSEKTGLIAVMRSRVLVTHVNVGWLLGRWDSGLAIGLDYTSLTVAIALQWGAHFGVDLVITSLPR